MHLTRACRALLVDAPLQDQPADSGMNDTMASEQHTMPWDPSIGIVKLPTCGQSWRMPCIGSVLDTMVVPTMDAGAKSSSEADARR